MKTFSSGTSKAQHRWLVEKLKTQTIPDIEAAALAPEPEVFGEPDHHEEPPPNFPSDEISDEDVPF